MGKLYYQAASDESTAQDKKDAFTAAGDKVFAQLADRKKDLYYGPFWRARINSLIDPSQPNDNAKTYYEETIRRIGDNKDYNSQLKEANRYLSFYYLKKNDDAQAKSYAEKVLAIDPSDKLASQIIKLVK